MSGVREAPILIVDDHEDNRDLIALVLRRAGYRVAQACHGQEALDHLEDGLRPSLIILDLAMPVMDGIEFRRQQVADERFRDIPLVVCSALQDADDVSDEWGVVGFRKPIEPTVVLECVRQYCRRD